MYLGNYLAFFAAIRTRYPHMRLISNCDMGQDAPTDIWVSGAAVAVVGGGCGCGCAGGGYWWLVVVVMVVVVVLPAGGGYGGALVVVVLVLQLLLLVFLDKQRLRWQGAVRGAKGGGTGRTQRTLAHPPPPALPAPVLNDTL
jgi:hypothetical protein